jgi:hypothetical protein
MANPRLSVSRERQAVCMYRVVSADTLSKRVTLAADTVRVQPSLFDGTERIDADFMPLPGKRYAVKGAQAGAATQCGWDF